MASKIIGEHPLFLRALNAAVRAAKTNASIVLTGESGTGKELVARLIHKESERSGPFVAINCGAIPEGLVESELFGHEKGAFTGASDQKKGCFETAHGGTLLLDEIADLQLETQVKLLRILQEKRLRRVGSAKEIPVVVRIIAATNQDLNRLKEAKKFRDDLYYRLVVVEIRLPSLRERSGDVGLLFDHFVEKHRMSEDSGITLTEEALECLERCHWPGNIRELENLVQRLLVFYGGQEDAVDSDCLPDEILKVPDEPEGEVEKVVLFAGATTCKQAERQLIEATMRLTNGNKTKCAELLGISARTLMNKLNQWEEEDRLRNLRVVDQKKNEG